MFLIEKFQQFYGEVLRVKAKVSEGTWVFEAQGAQADTSPTAVWRRLSSMLERQALEASREGGDFGVEIYRRAQYAMAALADEIFLHLDWAGREPWRQSLLEQKLFNSHRAGEELFERMDALLRDRDSIQVELARIYLIVLALGFQGKYRGTPEADAELESYRDHLHRFIHGREPQAVRGNEHLVPLAYASTLDDGQPSTVPYLKPWLWATAIVVLLWLAGTHFLWRRSVQELEPVVKRINSEEPAIPTAIAQRGGR